MRHCRPIWTKRQIREEANLEMRRFTRNVFAIAALAVASGSAYAATDVLNDVELVARVSAAFSAPDGPADRVLGTHRGALVLVDIRCGDVCPAYTVRVVHYGVEPGPACSQLGGDTASVAVPKGIAIGQQDFCVPHILYVRKLYVDHPYQK